MFNSDWIVSIVFKYYSKVLCGLQENVLKYFRIKYLHTNLFFSILCRQERSLDEINVYQTTEPFTVYFCAES